MLIHEHSRPGRKGAPQAPISKADLSDIPQHLLRKDRAALPEVS
jgi:glycine dehydrogenase subunit 2